MKTMTKTMMGMMMAAGVGYGAWKMMKKNNPEALDKLKNATQKTWKNTLDRLDNSI